MTPIEKAAKEAAARWFLSAENRDELAKEIVTHFAPIQKEMDEAREIINAFNDGLYDGPSNLDAEKAYDLCERAQSWLERNK